MSEAQLLLTWLGGPLERRLRHRRPGFDDMPWDSAATVVDVDDPAVAEARAVWTNGVFTEYASAAAFSAISLAMMEANVPVDLTAAAADFAVDELVHVNLVSRLVMSLGGAAPYVADLSTVAPAVSTRAQASPLLKVCELCIKVSCVGEALSLPALSASHRGAAHPLARAVLARLSHDEGPHAALGHWALAWADPQLSDDDRAHLSGVATRAVAVYAPLWAGAAGDVVVEGVAGPVAYRDYMQAAVDERIVQKLARYGIDAAAATPSAAP